MPPALRQVGKHAAAHVRWSQAERRGGRISLGFVAAALLALQFQGLPAETAPKVIEEVDFAISCAPTSQQAFKHAVWTLHSFWYPEALKEFTAIAASEPGCAMAYWGIAISHWYPLWYPPSPAALKAGSEAIAKAMAAPTQTPREADYIAAIAAFYRDNDKLDHQTRAVAYEKAMEQVYERYPDDREAAVFYALALNASALKTDKTFANQKKAAEILNKIWKEEPNHPGVVHYLIHSDNSPQFAAAGLDAAICYAKVAPDVPHALHMPSHIFTRLGMWQQSIDSNRAAHTAALNYVHQEPGAGELRPGNPPHDGLSRIRLSADRAGWPGQRGGRRTCRLPPERRCEPGRRLTLSPRSRFVMRSSAATGRPPPR